MIYFVVGLCLGMIVMAIICEKVHREELNDMRKQQGMKINDRWKVTKTGKRVKEYLLGV